MHHSYHEANVYFVADIRPPKSYFFCTLYKNEDQNWQSYIFAVNREIS